MVGTSSSAMQTKSRPSYHAEIQSMMFTFGEVRYPLASTSFLVEEYLHTHAIELLSKAAEISLIRGSKSIAPEDLIFVVRHDPAKVVRLKEFLSWKEIRKNVKSDTTDATFDDDSTGGVVNEDREIPLRKKSINFRWEFPRCLLNVCESDQSEDEEDLAEFNQELRERLEEADLLTKKMSKEEYMEFAECRQASFTYKKTKKFKDWLGFPERYKPSDDLLDIVGFLLWEFLRKLTIEALAIRGSRQKQKKQHPDTMAAAFSDGKYEDDTQLQSLRQSSLFYAPSEKCPLTPEIVKEAYANLLSNLH